MQQPCEHGRVLLARPRLVLMDESTGALGVATEARLHAALLLAKRYITHWPHAAGRVLLARPRLVLMDESTSALDVANEARLYAALREAGITFVSVGHRPTLTAFHDTVLRLEGEGEGEGGAGGGRAGRRNWRVLRAAEAEQAEKEAAGAHAAAL